jgi:hypothetical protein
LFSEKIATEMETTIEVVKDLWITVTNGILMIIFFNYFKLNIKLNMIFKVIAIMED